MNIIPNTNENRKFLFGQDILPLEKKGFSKIFDDVVHIETLYENAAVGYKDGGEAWAFKKEFGSSAINQNLSKCEDEICNEEKHIPIEIRVQEFIASHNHNELYTVENFSSWTRRLISACSGGRHSFIESNGLKIEDKCTVGYYLNLLSKLGDFYFLIPQEIKEYYKDDEVKYEITNFGSTV